MPFFKIKTNKQLIPPADSDFAKKASAFVASTLSKPEKYVMVAIDAGKTMVFGGETGPTAKVTLKSIGLAQDACPDLSLKICDFIESELEIPADRVFIDFCPLNGKMFGWNKSTF